jgi:hypothetical protein
MITPAFIDPPGAFASLEEWLRYRADLDALGDVPGIETFKREADAEIARLEPQ